MTPRPHTLICASLTFSLLNGLHAAGTSGVRWKTRFSLLRELLKETFFVLAARCCHCSSVPGCWGFYCSEVFKIFVTSQASTVTTMFPHQDKTLTFVPVMLSKTS